jgi:hypothetical protein
MQPIRKDVGLLLTRIERAAPAGDARLNTDKAVAAHAESGEHHEGNAH